MIVSVHELNGLEHDRAIVDPLLQYDFIEPVNDTHADLSSDQRLVLQVVQLLAHLGLLDNHILEGFLMIAKEVVAFVVSHEGTSIIILLREQLLSVNVWQLLKAVHLDLQCVLRHGPRVVVFVL